MFKTYYSTKNVHHKGLTCDDLSKTQQDFLPDCDLDAIVRKFMRTGVIDPGLVKAIGHFMDVTEVTDYASAQRFLASANSMFENLPAHVRHHFNDDPSQMLAFINDASNREAAEAMGFKFPERVGVSAPLDKITPTDTVSPVAETKKDTEK